MDILKEIFDGSYSIHGPLSQEYYKALEEKSDLYEKIQSTIGDQTLDRLWSAGAEVSQMEGYHYFLAGLRLGMAVMQKYYQ